MQTLYEWDFRPESDIDEIKNRNIANYEEDADEKFIADSLKSILENQKNIDLEISKAAPEWPIEQISTIDKTILRIAINEILYNSDVPPKVAINEAVELGKNFGGQNSSKFINGVLGTVYRSSPNFNPKDDVKTENQNDAKENDAK